MASLAEPAIGCLLVNVGFSIPVRVYYEDTDSGGVVYYANYLRYLERARTEWLRERGFDIQELAQRDHRLFAVRSVSIEYLKPAKLSNLLEVSVKIEKIGGASLELEQEVWRDTEQICTARVRLACLNTNTLEPCAIPKPVIDELIAWKTS